MLDLCVGGGCVGRDGEDDLGYQVTLTELGRERAAEELRGLERSLPALGAHDEPCSEREHDRGEVGRGVGVGEAPTDRASVANLEVADLGGAVGDRRQRCSLHLGRVGELVPGGERSDAKLVPLQSYAAEIETPDVDEDARPDDS
jgi:hypothetical protein